MSMKLSCPTCQARYTIADDKVRGRIVRIRCRRCGAIVVASEAPPSEEVGHVGAEAMAPAPGPRTGERHEQSVLFSLAALRPPPPPAAACAAPSDASGLIDLKLLARAMRSAPPGPPPGDAVAFLGTGGVFTPPLLGAETGATNLVVPTRDRSGSARSVLAFALGVAIVLPPCLLLATRTAPTVVHAHPAAPLASSVGVAAPSVTLAASPATSPASAASVGGEPASAPKAPTTPRASARSSATARKVAAASASARPVPSASAAPTSPGPRCCSGEAEIDCAMRRSLGVGCAR